MSLFSEYQQDNDFVNAVCDIAESFERTCRRVDLLLDLQMTNAKIAIGMLKAQAGDDWEDFLKEAGIEVPKKDKK